MLSPFISTTNASSGQQKTDLKEPQTIHVTKASGQRQLFSVEKLRGSLKRAGATEPVIDEVVAELQKNLYEGISTKKLYSAAHRLLRRLSRPEAARYHLKKAIMQLGPSGFPFEKFIARLFAEAGYQTSTSLLINGKCVQHEIDVLGKLNTETMLAECKYHNRGGVAVDVKIALYVNSRFQDISAGTVLQSEKITGYLITNARFTSDAIRYGECAGMKLISWDYPPRFSLRDRIDSTLLYPLTCLSTLTTHEKSVLLESGLVLARDLAEQASKTERLLGAKRSAPAFEEAGRLCAGNDRTLQ